MTLEEIEIEIEKVKNRLNELELLAKRLKSVNPYQSLLEIIAKGEGTSADKALKKGYASEYDITLGYGAYVDDRTVPLTTMSLDDVQKLQKKMLRNPKNGLNSSAVGKYQIVSRTLRGLIRNMKLTGREKFTPVLQDKMAIELLKGRGLHQFLEGKITQKDFHNRLSREWASIARFGSKKGSYGQRVGTKSRDLDVVLRDIQLQEH